MHIPCKRSKMVIREQTLLNTHREYNELIKLGEQRTKKYTTADYGIKPDRTDQKVERKEVNGDWIISIYPDGHKRWERLIALE